MPEPATGVSERANALFGFDGEFLRRLERLAVLNRRPVSGAWAGRRRAVGHGTSVEFADFRDYAPGDDFRRIDWNAFARLDRLFLRLYQAEHTTRISLWLDHSRSMGFGDPPKAVTAARLAAIMAYIGLHTYDELDIFRWTRRIDGRLSRQSGKGAIPQTWRFIEESLTRTDGQTDFGALKEIAGTGRKSGVAIVLSDFLTDSDWRLGLRALCASGREVTAIQILAPEEVKPELRGDWSLVDAESGAQVEVTVSPRLLKRYEEELSIHTTALTEFCRRQGIAFVRVVSDESIGDQILGRLHAAGVLG